MGGVLRVAWLGWPGSHVFDEVYYAKDAKAILDGRVGPTAQQRTDGLAWEPGDVVSWPHPEMGKLAIAVGIAVLGDGSWGWRVVPALAGLALLTLVYPLARRLRLPRPWALAALVLAASDTLLLAQSRIATLDVFVGLWTVLCVYLALRYVQERRWWWLPLCGLAGGMAVGTKWSGALALAAAALVLLLCRRRQPGVPLGRRTLDGLLTSLLAVLCLVVLPAAVYFASYVVYFADGHDIGQWWELQRQMRTFNLNLTAEHSYASRAHTWIFDVRPVWYFYEGEPEVRGVIAMGNPLLWWATVPAVLGLLGAAIARRDTRLLLPPLLVLALYLPWLATGRTSFLYYMTPVVPFMTVTVAWGLALLAGPARVRCAWAGAAFAGGALGMYLLWYRVGWLAEKLFWTLPGQVSRGTAIGVSTLAVAVVLAVLVATYALPRLRPAWRYLTWGYVGVAAGTAAVFLPIVLARGISVDEFYRLMWFSSWI